jgi:hypothetical protein
MGEWLFFALNGECSNPFLASEEALRARGFTEKLGLDRSASCHGRNLEGNMAEV